MTLYELARKHMEDNNLAALCNPDTDCSCALDDLFDCGEPSPHCTFFRYVHDCDTCARKDDCDLRESDLHLMCSDDNCWVPCGVVDDGREG
ncbi:MAG: hypothetical protein FWE09_00240 [Treponema sp.]|nr:hypothetical protein [Treponema sp.]